MGKLTSTVVGTALVLASASSACAQAELFARDTFSGLVDLRLVAADGETSWIDGRVGKARFGDGHQGLRLGEAALVWNPRFSDTVSAVVVGESQDGQRHLVDLGEGYLAYRSRPGSAMRLSARAGVFYPPISLEHDGLDWSVPDTITPSAINTWVAEETKVVGVEATIRRTLAGQTFSLTAGGFKNGDTSGTELTFRGWALHDLKSPVFGRFPLPPLSPRMAVRQAPSTTPLAEIDGRVGYYGRVEWRPSSVLTFDLFGSENEGDRTSVNDYREWSWETRFWNLGMRLDLDAVAVKAQVLTGETLMGYSNALGLWADMGFEAAYVSAGKALGRGSATVRYDHFSTTDRTNKATDNNAEHGWSGLAAYRWDVKPNSQIVFEALHIDSFRRDRVRLGLAPRQSQTVLQTAFRRQF
ncbi:hypothetical protein [Caulobacter sp. 1776]|uniref:hypothetical protein n=1 Tax=Caulobacter sp. 1776 TaxID=3156420 RepID=UPI003399AFDF